jgi:lipoprotein-releasing system ATP-binding protein
MNNSINSELSLSSVQTRAYPEINTPKHSVSENFSAVPPVLSCKNLSKTFFDGALFVEVFKQLNFTVAPGERVAVVGPSGAGKSTLLHILGGLDTPTSGEVRIAGHDMAQLSDVERSKLRNRYLGFVYQFHHLLPEFTVLENICVPLLLRGTKPQIARDKGLRLLAKVGLEKRQQHKLGQLSGGERQRAAIIRALITDPLCVLADEPTGNLDARTAEKVYQMMLELNQEFNTSLIIVTHDLNLAAKMDRVLQLEDGVLKAT